jgi:hypothetical protein
LDPKIQLQGTFEEYSTTSTTFELSAALFKSTATAASSSRSY